uniref:Serine-threonine/tyrosine-protein kinase catalytic domain-containing protein n=1 Tax=Timema bartmani TaxID=61472 RepID=A0A7R9EQH2_9NEOP|nr:unnamed protein product [Timema bartmani]
MPKSRKEGVHLCEAEGVPEYGASSFHKKQFVVVKSLWRGCSEATRQEFLRETSWLASLRDTNLARIVGVCSQEEPLCAVQEHSELGDLPQFLQLQGMEAEEGGSSLRSAGYEADVINTIDRNEPQD